MPPASGSEPQSPDGHAKRRFSREPSPCAGAGHAEDLAHEDRAPRHGGLVDGGQRAGAAADRRLALGLGADQEAGHVDEVDDRQAELVAQVDEARLLLRGVGGHAAAVVLGVGGDDADRPALEPGQRGDDRPAEAPAELEDRAAVEDQLEHPAHVVVAARVARHDRQQLLLAPVGRVGRRQRRRRLPDRRRQVGQEAADLRERVLLVARLVVDGAGAGLQPRAAELLLVGRLAHRGGHQRRPGDEQLRGAADDHAEVAHHHARGAEARRTARARRRRPARG